MQTWLQLLIWLRIRQNKRKRFKSDAISLEVFYENSNRAKSEFRFKMRDIEIIADIMELPRVITLPGGSKIGGLMALCVFLKRFAYPTRLFDLENFFRIERYILLRDQYYQEPSSILSNDYMQILGILFKEMRSCLSPSYWPDTLLPSWPKQRSQSELI